MTVDNSVSILSDITIYNKYAKYLPHLERRENWLELCIRNAEMHVAKYPELAEEIWDVYSRFVVPKKVLPSMRSLQFGGRPIELAHNRIYNCGFLPIDHPDAFSEMMFLLLGGTGGGYSVQKFSVAALPTVKEQTEARRFLIGDSIEGWADTIKVLVESYFYGKARPNFIYDDIREKGAPLITSGGKAPGPEPLKTCVEQLDKLFSKAIGRQLTTLEAHDAVCLIADAVLAGGIRRAALISLFSRDDEEMLKCKSNFDVEVTKLAVVDEGMYSAEVIYKGETRQIWLDEEQMIQLEDEGTAAWYHFEPHRGRANNSVVLPRGEVSKDEFFDLWQIVEDSGAGEPGFYWTNDETWGTNPCCEIGLRPFQFCNLTEVNSSDVESQEDLNERVKAAAFLGTLQAGYTDFHYLRQIWKETTEKDALIGVGMTGIGSGAVLQFDLAQAARIVIAENARVANILGINPAARTGTVKPAGTSSLVLGSASGIHAWHNDYYIRRMRVGKNEALYMYMLQHMPALVEDDVFNPAGAVLSFPQKAPEGAILRTESPIELLERVKRFNLEWVRAGHIDGHNTHNVSCTISLDTHHWKECGEWMWENRAVYNGISVLPHDGGTYVQAPFEDCTKEVYEDMAQHLARVNLDDVKEVNDNTDLTGEIACGAGGCEVS